eukprot:gnl/TRDRNA2_/TRDRNA2_168072_c0_seq4.p1 gnl/TRDRNA2_/TRDRNA2_168072_c0~~gnl/TRDRNA2_/TRDRNA2_168072_c0_seq4.p1  ORF type:complete len:303 (-),score=9.26 gnl/TRDRNA2_/TRDRNA2_168072_c0_seq4:12-920(-)
MAPLMALRSVRFFWVSDAESLPFSKHNLEELMKTNVAHPRAVFSTWHDEPACSKVMDDEGTDSSCATFVTSLTNGMRYKNDTRKSLFTPKRWRQIYSCVDQWWMYHRQTTLKWLDFLKETTKREAWDLYSYLELSDASVYRMMSEWAASYVSPQEFKVQNIREEIRTHFPLAFKKCCACGASKHDPDWTSHAPPCLSVIEISGGGIPGGCLAKMIPERKRMTLLVDKLGIFGMGNYNRFMYVEPSFLNVRSQTGGGTHWCVNNCFKPEALQRMLKIVDADTEGLSMFTPEFMNTTAFKERPF